MQVPLGSGLVGYRANLQGRDPPVMVATRGSREPRNGPASPSLRRDRSSSAPRSVHFRAEIGRVPHRDRFGSAPRSVLQGSGSQVKTLVAAGRRSSRTSAARCRSSSSWVMSSTTAPSRALCLTACAIESRWRRSTPELGSS